MPATWVSPDTDNALCRSAFSYAERACSRSPICSATLPKMEKSGDERGKKKKDDKFFFYVPIRSHVCSFAVLSL